VANYLCNIILLEERTNLHVHKDANGINQPTISAGMPTEPPENEINQNLNP